MNQTNIAWALNPDGTRGFTSNPIRGKCPVDCSYCYVKGFRQRYDWHDDVRFYPGELAAIFKRRKPAGIFVGSTFELWHPSIAESWKRQILKITQLCPQHRFYILTKCPQELVKWSPFPPNCWVGVSATHDGDIGHAEAALSQVQASVKYISVEPLLEHMVGISPLVLKESGIDWLIIGAQTKPTVMPKVEWVREIVEAADRAGVRVFLKDSLWPLLEPVFEAAGCIDNYFDDTGLLRQEMPEGVPCAV